MPIEIKITGDTMADINAAFKGMVGLNAHTIPLDDLLAVTSSRFAKEGFKITVNEANKEAPPAPPPEIVPVEAEIAAEAASDEPPKRKRGRPVGSTKKAPEPEPEVEPEEDDDTNVVQMTPKPEPDADRAYVLDQLSQRFADLKQKTKTKAFIDRVAGRNGGVRLSRLPPELFPAIRAEMEVYFGGNGHGHAA